MSRSPRCVSRSAIVEETLNMISEVKKANQSLLWGAINVLILSVLLYDILYKCPTYSTAFYYGEVGLAVILALSTIFHIARYVYVNWFLKPVVLTPQQRHLMGVSKLDPHFKGVSETPTTKNTSLQEKQRSPSPVRHTPKKLFSSPSSSQNASPMPSPCSPSSFNSSMFGNSSASILSSPNYSLSSPSWVYHQSTSGMPNLIPAVGPSPYSPSGAMPTLTPYPLSPSFVGGLISGQSNLFSPSSFNLSDPGRSTANPKPLFETSFLADIQQQSGVTTTPVNPNKMNSMSTSSPIASPLNFSPNGTQSQQSLLYRCTYQLAPLMSAMLPGRGRGDSKKRDSENWTGIAHSSPLSSGSSSSPSTTSPSSGSAHAYGTDTWQRVGVNIAFVERWTMNLRVWLSQTVVERIVQEIDSINDALGWNSSASGLTGSTESVTEEQGIGNVSLERLRSAALVPHIITAAPNLSLLIPFLEASPNQKYLVARIRKLAEGGCMSSFNWSSENVEGSSSIRPTSDALQCPTDAFILAHLFATYLDTQMPSLPPSAVFLSQDPLKTPASVLSSIPSQSSSPGAISPGPQTAYFPLPLESPESRPFSIRHFARIPEELIKKRKGAEEGGGHMIIYQARQNPPHFQLVTPEEVFDVGKGRNNLFHTILLFLYLIKTREHGVLGRVSLGKSGINMLWVIDGE